jgi:hypothetical protein
VSLQCMDHPPCKVYPRKEGGCKDVAIHSCASCAITQGFFFLLLGYYYYTLGLVLVAILFLTTRLVVCTFLFLS